MPYCDGCRRDIPRRKKIFNKLICNYCYNLLRDPLYLLQKYYISEKKLVELEKKTSKNSSPFFVVPPVHILENAKLALNIKGFYNDFAQVLSNYYQIPSPEFLHDETKVPKDAIACYYDNENKVFSKSPLSLHTAFHEFYHVLERFDLVYKASTVRDRQKNADLYADACLKLLS